MANSNYFKLHLSLAVLLSALLLTVVWTFNDGFHPSMFFAFACALTFIWSHIRLTSSPVFLAEITDQFSHGEANDVLMFGVNIQKRFEIALPKDTSFFSYGESRIVLAIVSGIFCTYLATKSVGVTTGFLIFIVLLAWAFSRRRAFLWLPVCAGALFLNLVFARHHIFQILSVGLFLAYYSVYRQSFLSWASTRNPRPLEEGSTGFIVSFIIFLAVFALSTFLLPDRPLQENFRQKREQLANKLVDPKLRSKITRSLSQIWPKHEGATSGSNSGERRSSQQDGQSPMDNRASSNGKQGDGRSGAGGGSGPTSGSGQGKPSSGSDGGKQASGSPSQSGATGPTSTSSGQTSLNNSGQGDQSGPSSGNSSAKSSGGAENSKSATAQSGGSSGPAGGAPTPAGQNAKSNSAVGQTDPSSPNQNQTQQTSGEEKEEDGGSAGGPPQSESPEAARAEAKKNQVEQEIHRLNAEKTIDDLIKFLKLVLIVTTVIIFWRLTQKSKASEVSQIEKANRKGALRIAIEKIRDLNQNAFRSQSEEVVAAYHAYLALMASNGFVKLDWQTPSQFEEEVTRLHGPMHTFSGDLARCFSKVYYGHGELNRDEYLHFKKYIRRIAI